MARWVERYKVEGRAGMADRSSRPIRMPQATPALIAERIVALRRQRFPGRHIAHEVGVSPATVSRVLKRAGLSRLKDITPAEPVRRYERAHPGEMIHIDIKKLGRFERVGHRIAFSQILPDERKESAVAFLDAAVAYYKSLGVTVTGVMTDNGSCYRSEAFAHACRELGLKHIRTRPYTPRTNGKAERFIQTALREWAYAVAYPTSRHRAAELPTWLHR